jgi:hypothetical protein
MIKMQSELLTATISALHHLLTLSKQSICSPSSNDREFPSFMLETCLIMGWNFSSSTSSPSSLS